MRILIVYFSWLCITHTLPPTHYSPHTAPHTSPHTLPPTAEGECPPDVPIVRCIADPCVVSSCPNIPNVKCESNYCGGCNAVFYDAEGNDVTAGCVDGPTCDDGSALVLCFTNPCDVSRCPSFPDAVCQANYCGGCNAWYFNGTDRANVTDMCGTSKSP